jgi:hypothetical protein
MSSFNPTATHNYVSQLRDLMQITAVTGRGCLTTARWEGCDVKKRKTLKHGEHCIVRKLIGCTLDDLLVAQQDNE